MVSKMPRKLSQEEFVERVKNINPNIEVLGQYSGSNKKVLCRCRVCQNTWSPVPDTIYSGHGCPTCAGYKRRTTKSFREEMAEISPNIEIIGEFKGVDKKIKCRCRICNDTWAGNPSVLLRGGGCPACAGNKKKTTESFVSELSEINNSIKVLGEYKNLYEPIRCQCLVCGDVWMPTPKALLTGHGCAKCAKNKKKTTDSFIKELRKINPEIEVLGEYVNQSTGILCKCNICENEWMAKPQHLLRGQGCPNCYHSSTSFLEIFIFEAFEFVFGEGKVFHRDTETIGKEMDIYIPEIGVAIEPGSYYWHKDKIEEDLEKQSCAEKAGIRMIIIYDACIEPSPLLGDDIWTYEVDLGSEKDISLMQTIVYRLFDAVGIERVFSNDEWDEIRSYAHKHSRRKTTEVFIQELSVINPDIEVLGEYEKSNKKIKCRCTVCGHIWSAVPTSLLQGHGCSKCAKVLRRTPEQFIEEVKKISPELTILGTFENTKAKIETKCNLCGHVWSPAAGGLLAGQRCPFCSAKKAARVHAKAVVCISTNERFDTLSDAAKKYGVATSNLSKCCKGRIKTCAELRWKYAED